jgi:hypothetical protein
VNFSAAVSDYEISESVDVVCTLLVAVGSSVNPILYGWLDMSFRAAFKRLLAPIFKRLRASRKLPKIRDGLQHVPWPMAFYLKNSHLSVYGNIVVVRNMGCDNGGYDDGGDDGGGNGDDGDGNGDKYANDRCVGASGENIVMPFHDCDNGAHAVLYSDSACVAGVIFPRVRRMSAATL